MTVLDSIERKLYKWKSEKAYGYFVVQYDYEPKLYIGQESWNMLRKEVGELMYPMTELGESSPEYVYGLEVVLVDKKFYLEVE